MSKYSEEELRDMARVTLAALESNNLDDQMKGHMVLQMTVALSGLTEDEVMRRIRDYANRQES